MFEKIIEVKDSWTEATAKWLMGSRRTSLEKVQMTAMENMIKQISVFEKKESLPRDIDGVIIVLDRLQATFASRSIVNQLSAVDVTDYERGKVAGKINMLSKLMMEIVDYEAENNTKDS